MKPLKLLSRLRDRNPTYTADRAHLCEVLAVKVSLDDAHQLMEGRLSLQPHKAVELAPSPTWAEDPLGDRNWCFQYHALRWAQSLRHGWEETQRREFLDLYFAILRSWFEGNPRSAPPSRFSWDGHATAHRATIYACAAQSFPNVGWLQDAVRAHGEALSGEDFYERHGNHALNQNIALVACGEVLNMALWISIGVSRLEHLITESVDKQGGTNEQAVDYQHYNFQAYSRARRLLEACGVPVPESFRRVQLMPQMLAHGTLPNGEYEMLGDTEARPARIVKGTVAEYAASRGAAGPVPEHATALFHDAGFLFGRQNWQTQGSYTDQVHYSLRFGETPRIHGHDDGGSLTLYGFGERLIVDAGKYSYQQDEFRKFFVSREAHNVVVTDAERSSAPTALLEHTSRNDVDITRIRQAPYRGVEIERCVFFSRTSGFIIVDDSIRSDEDILMRQLWHLREDSNPLVNGTSVTTTRPRGNVAIFQLADQPNISLVSGQRKPLQGWVSYHYGDIVAANTIESAIQGHAARFLTLLVPFAEVSPEISWRECTVGPRHFSVRVNIGDEVTQVSSGDI